MVILLMGAVSLPAVADVSGAADAVNEAGAPSQTTTQSDALRQASGDLEQSYAWDKSGNDQLADGLLQGERTGSAQTMTWIAQVLLLLVPIGLGLTIAFTSLRKDMRRRRRIPYRQRGPRSIGEHGEIA